MYAHELVHKKGQITSPNSPIPKVSPGVQLQGDSPGHERETEKVNLTEAITPEMLHCN